MKNIPDRRVADEILAPLLADERVLAMKNYIQHGTVNTFDHCLSVAYACYDHVCRHGSRVDLPTLLRAAMLHDYYLYDWHQPGDGSHHWHGFRHPRRARNNACRDFSLDRKAASAIDTHMWPLTFWRLPRSREAWVLTWMDKRVSFAETLAGKKRRARPSPKDTPRP